MAKVITNSLKTLRLLRSINSNRFLSTAGTQYAKAKGMFPEYYLEPVFRHEDLAQLQETGALAERANVPIRPPKAYQTCSVYHDELCNYVMNMIMELGKKPLARSLLEKSFENMKRTQIERYHLAADDLERAKIELSPKVILHKAVENCRPLLQLLPVKRGGITYQVPSPISPKRSLFLSVKWLIDGGMDKDRKVRFAQQFAWELIDASNGTGRVIKKKQDLHRQCEANRAYAHYRWS